MNAHLPGLGATVLFDSSAITPSPRPGHTLGTAGLDALRVSLDGTWWLA